MKQPTLPIMLTREEMFMRIRGGFYVSTKRERVKQLENEATANPTIELLRKLHRADQAYRKDIERLYRQFKADCFESVGLTKHPKRSKIWNRIEEEHINDGLHTMYYYFLTIIDFLKDIDYLK